MGWAVDMLNDIKRKKEMNEITYCLYRTTRELIENAENLEKNRLDQDFLKHLKNIINSFDEVRDVDKYVERYEKEKK